ncbi:acylphosphatase [Shimia abyssi]|uniref:acylphosphatase n=1 Tax=Shimia abyssi TaxID=1662395 RepID=A0A2P8FKH4_9RHOB|nr:acylphosphatase [Shimia abyssi]PSL22227.1 acylphosphatase [Shimia abyssi]
MSQTVPDYAKSVKITGRVQSVAFRAWTRSRATTLGLTGWVRNDPTGSVSAFVQGDRASVDTLVEEFWSGPGVAAVRDVQSQFSPPDPSLNTFEIQR